MGGETEAARAGVNLSLTSSLGITQVMGNPPHRIPAARTSRNDKNREPNPRFQVGTTKH